jgi:hypothetical protein
MNFKEEYEKQSKAPNCFIVKQKNGIKAVKDLNHVKDEVFRLIYSNNEFYHFVNHDYTQGIDISYEDDYDIDIKPYMKVYEIVGGGNEWKECIKSIKIYIFQDTPPKGNILNP